MSAVEMTGRDRSDTDRVGARLPLASLRDLRHEVGNALTPALGHVQRLQRSFPSWAEEDDRHTLDALRESIARALRLLETAASAELAQPAEQCNLVNALAAALAAMPEQRFRDTQVRINTAVPLVGTWPEWHIVQVLVNLLLNAAKYSPAGSPIEVTLDAGVRSRGMHARGGGSGGGGGGDGGGGDPEWAQRADVAVVLIQDYGIGVPPEDSERIFEGHRTDRARAYAVGEGIGLRLSRRVATSAGGRLWTERRGAATTFVLELPLLPT